MFRAESVNICILHSLKTCSINCGQMFLVSTPTKSCCQISRVLATIDQLYFHRFVNPTFFFLQGLFVNLRRLSRVLFSICKPVNQSEFQVTRFEKSDTCVCAKNSGILMGQHKSLEGNISQKVLETFRKQFQREINALFPQFHL